MRVDSGRQRVLLDLAEVDAQITRLDHSRTHLPEDAEIAEIDRKVEVARDDLVRAEIAAEDLGREYKRIEGEVNGMSSREARDSQLLTAGGLAAKALSELQHELTGLARRRGILEDELLSIMEQQEALSGEEQRAAATVDQLGTDLASVQERRAAALATLDEDRAVADTRRASIVSEVDPELLAIYDRQRSAGKVGAGLLRARRCGACRMELDRGTIAGIAAADPSEVIRCEECGAVLVRTSESGL
ncbi:zinc ribbon domain-containing protein [Gordonia soli]|uniref:Uncharacterized protein n=1 Tax=Gordonia soli NBRC 108243 TaxID=1223545 RepID=M0QLN1_9ACTN|nr:C4-type zinc ribbon domain-containing protein [Gordonia soli]GAC69463.1 hypothetical protein GS4_25_00340 [Gordonia soli NBRC 108243]